MIKCRTFEDVKQVYGEQNLIKIVNLRQILCYAKMKCQPVWIDEGYSGKLVAFFVKRETDMAWKYWREHEPKNKPD